MKTRSFKRVYVWELPVRFFHWINVLCILILTGTGFIIADPPTILSSNEAGDLHTFGFVRYIHFTAGYIFFFNMILRIYWSFVGNQFSHWKSFWPFTKKMWRNIKHVFTVDILLQNKKIHKLKNISIGHNSIAAISYIGLFLLAIIQIITGFGLYADSSGWWLPKLFAGIIPFLGGDFVVRQIHHVSMWGFIFFTLIHVYLVFYHDWLEGRAEVSSMFGGYKFVDENRLRKKEPSSSTETL